MKKILFCISTIALFVVAACNNNGKSSSENDMSKMNMDTTQKAVVDTTPMTEIAHSFSNVDPRLAASLKTVVDHYLHIKNARVNNSGNDAASGGKEMADAIDKVDKSLF